MINEREKMKFEFLVLDLLLSILKRLPTREGVDRESEWSTVRNALNYIDYYIPKEDKEIEQNGRERENRRK